MMASFIVEGVRFDFRSVLFAYTIVYLDQDIAISTILLLDVGRYFFGDLGLSTTNLIIGLVYIATNLAIFDYIKAKYSTFFQLWLLTMLAIVVAVPISYIRLDSTTLTLSAYLLQAAVSSVFIYITYHFTSDLDKLYDSSVQDSLTVLYNARKLEEDLEKISENNHSYSLLILDIENFKHLNDTYGHLVGDKALEEIGIILNDLKSDLYDYYRYGGEEFVSLVFDWSGQRTLELAEAIHQRIAEMTLLSEEGETLQITVSIGVAHRKPHGNMKNILLRADQALYQAKNQGKNQTVIATSGLNFD